MAGSVSDSKRKASEAGSTPLRHAESVPRVSPGLVEARADPAMRSQSRRERNHSITDY